MTMQLIATQTVGAGGAASIDFTSIPGTYTDLYLTLSARATSGSSSAILHFNGITTNESSRLLLGNGSATSSGTISTNMYVAVGLNDSAATANTFSSADLYIPNYAGNKNKSSSSQGVNENNATNSNLMLIANLWSNTAAITSISLTSASGNFAQYSTASLYGITKGSGGANVA